MSNLEKILKHYGKIAGTNKSPTASAYALGALEMAQQVKIIRGTIEKDMKELWKKRNEDPLNRIRITALRNVLNLLDNINDPQINIT